MKAVRYAGEVLQYYGEQLDAWAVTAVNVKKLTQKRKMIMPPLGSCVVRVYNIIELLMQTCRTDVAFVVLQIKFQVQYIG